jgi:Glu-tRNA(Gln) amidotransferase subunit E-like FAD-binding protein
MMPLMFAERLILESLTRGAKKETALRADTGMDENILAVLLQDLVQKELIKEEGQIWQINLAARDALIDLLKTHRQRRTEVEDLMHLMVKAKMENKGRFIRMHMKKVYLSEVQQIYLDRLLHKINVLLESAAHTPITHDLKDETVFLWGSARCEDLGAKYLATN